MIPATLRIDTASEAEIVRFSWADRLQPHGEVAAIAGELPRDRDILVHCKMGGRSAKACAALAEAGLEPQRLYNLDGGIVGWAQQVDPSITYLQVRFGFPEHLEKVAKIRLPSLAGVGAAGQILPWVMVLPVDQNRRCQSFFPVLVSKQKTCKRSCR